MVLGSNLWRETIKPTLFFFSTDISVQAAVKPGVLCVCRDSMDTSSSGPLFIHFKDLSFVQEKKRWMQMRECVFVWAFTTSTLCRPLSGLWVCEKGQTTTLNCFYCPSLCPVECSPPYSITAAELLSGVGSRTCLSLSCLEVGTVPWQVDVNVNRRGCWCRFKPPLTVCSIQYFICACMCLISWQMAGWKCSISTVNW